MSNLIWKKTDVGYESGRFSIYRLDNGKFELLETETTVTGYTSRTLRDCKAKADALNAVVEAEAAVTTEPLVPVPYEVYQDAQGWWATLEGGEIGVFDTREDAEQGVRDEYDAVYSRPLPVTNGKGGQFHTPRPSDTEDPVDVPAAVPPVPAPKPSPLAAAVAEAKATPVPSADEPPHLVVEARAGTGKTTTLVGALQVLLGGVPKAADGKPITPSPQQKAVWDAVALSRGRAKSVAFVAFNKSVAAELQTRVPPGVRAMTNHSMGFAAVRNAFPSLRVNEYRVDDLIQRVLGVDVRVLRKDKPVVLKAAKQLVDLCKMNLVGHGWSEGGDKWDDALAELADHYGVDLENDGGVSFKTEVFDLVPRVLELCADPAADGCLDYADMIWLPVVLNLPVVRYDLLMVDEAQDLNRCQQALVKRAGKRLVLCGDPKQAIYGFAGADCESMTRMARELGDCKQCNGKGYNEAGVVPGLGFKPCAGCSVNPGCVILPLTVTRRCGKAIVAEAKKLVPDFAAHESNPVGIVSRATFPVDENGSPRPGPHYSDRVEYGDMIVCRVNAPLVGECFRFLRAGRKANVLGRDVGQGLVNTVKKLMRHRQEDQGGGQTVELLTRLDDWLHDETTKEMAKRNPRESKLIGLRDKADCLTCFAAGCTFVIEVVKKIESVFTDDRDGPGIKLSSIHKAKGLEARRVFFLTPKGAECPHPMAKSEWEYEQELNLRYVAVTRAIEELVFVS